MTTVTCVALTGLGSYMTIGDIPLVGVADYTVEGWWRIQAYDVQDIVANKSALFSKYVSTSEVMSVYFEYRGRVGWKVNSREAESGEVHPVNVWQHVALVTVARRPKLYLNGTLRTGILSSHTVLGLSGVNAYFGGPTPACFDPHPVGGYMRMGWQRISNVARDLSDRGSPAVPPATDANTLGLWYCNEGSGTTVTNQTGNAAYDGVLTGCAWVESDLDTKRRSGRPELCNIGARRANAPALGNVRGYE